jgi:hypothetical protein
VTGASPDGPPTPGTGEPPKERWADILANARTKAAEDALAPLAWARNVQPQEFQTIRDIAKHFTSGNAAEGLQSLVAEVSRDPRYADAIRSWQGRALQMLRQQQPQQQAAPPQDMRAIPVQLENGQTIGLFSGEQVQALVNNAIAAVKQDLAPVTQTVQGLQAERQALHQQQQVQSFVTTTFQDVQTWPGMESQEARTLVAKELEAAQINPHDPNQVSLALNAAWRRVIAPTLGRNAEARLLDSLKTKAAAATGVNPGSSAPSASKPVTKFSDLGADAWR